MLKELRTRENDGIRVVLSYDDSSKERPEIPPLVVSVTDVKRSRDFRIACDTVDEANEAFYHPFATANRALKTGKVAA
jgi:hypothetical protein